MQYLNKPNFGKSAKEIFEICVKGFTDPIRKNKLLAVSKFVEADSLIYNFDFPNNLLDLKTKDPMVNGITSEDMAKVYNQKFARLNSVGREYYDAIMTLAILGICPICGVRTVSNLDHFLPKSKFSTLVVTPDNLIPICRDCNTDKSSVSFSSVSEVPIHPYFDHIDDEKWLFAFPEHDQTIHYKVQCPDHWNSILKNRIKESFKIYKLGTFYSKRAAQEAAEEIRLWKKIYSSANGAAQLLEHLYSQLESIEAYYNNSWRAALYAGLIRDFDTVVRWL